MSAAPLALKSFEAIVIPHNECGSIENKSNQMVYRWETINVIPHNESAAPLKARDRA